MGKERTCTLRMGDTLRIRLAGYLPRGAGLILKVANLDDVATIEGEVSKDERKLKCNDEDS